MQIGSYAVIESVFWQVVPSLMVSAGRQTDTFEDKTKEAELDWQALRKSLNLEISKPFLVFSFTA
jgi:hypothetical protein